MALVAGVMLAVAAPPTAPVRAEGEITPQLDARRKINLAGRQRTLSQFIARAVCFATIGVEGAAQMQDRMSAKFLFDQTLIDLREGSPVQGILPEQNAAILASLDRQAASWKSYQVAIAAEQLGPILAEGEKVFAAADATVTLIEQKLAPAAGVDPMMAATLNKAGMTRTLLQRAVKAFCYVAAGHEVAANRATIRTAVERLDLFLAKLATGDDALRIMAPPVAEIGDQLVTVETYWAPLRTVLKKAGDGAAASREEVTLVAQKCAKVLEELNAIVSLYQELAAG